MRLSTEAKITIVGVLLLIAGIVVLLITAYANGLRDGQRAATPVALTPAHDTTVIYRVTLVPPPRPDTALRYECKATP